MENYGEESIFIEEPIKLQKVIGFNKDFVQSMHNLSLDQSRQLFQPSSNTGVIQDWVAKSNLQLQGHMNIITCSGVAQDKSFIITADKGENAMIIKWDAKTGDPIRTFTNLAPAGHIALDISYDGQFVALLSSDPHHSLQLQDLNGEVDMPLIECPIEYKDLQKQFQVKFNEDNPFELVTNNTEYCIFWNWTLENEHATFSMQAKKVPGVDGKTEELRMTCFIPHRAQAGEEEDPTWKNEINRAITGTNRGRVVIWDEDQFSNLDADEHKRSVLKVIDLAPDKAEEGQGSVKSKAVRKGKHPAINIVTVVDKQIVVGINDGRICFQDSKLRIEGQFEVASNFKGESEISSISFAATGINRADTSQDGLAYNPAKFKCPDFIVAYKCGLVQTYDYTQFTNIAGENDVKVPILNGLEKEVVQMSVHPIKTEIAITCKSKDGKAGKIELWDQEKCEIKKDKNFPKEASAIEQSPDGTHIVIAWDDGTLHSLVYDDDVLSKLDENSRTVFEDGNIESQRIRKIKFSPDSKFFAVCNNTSVSLFAKKEGSQDRIQNIVSHPDPKIPYNSYDRSKLDTDSKFEHPEILTDFCFSEVPSEREEEKYALFSVGNDRMVVQHQIQGEKGKLKDVDSIIVKQIRIEWDFVPKSICAYPQMKEHLLAISNSDQKVKLFSLVKDGFQHTQQGPDFGEISESTLKTLWGADEEGEEDKYQIFSTANSILGMIRKPIDGNPHKNIGIVAHPTPLRNFCVKASEGLIFTSGGEDLSIKVWSVNKEAIERQLQMADGLVELSEEEKLIQMVGNVELFQDMKDQFQQTQLRDASKGQTDKDAKQDKNVDREKTKKTRILTDSIPVDEMPNIFRALGYYPSDLEIEYMKNEIRAINDTFAMEGTRKHDQVTFNVLVKIFVNQRPYNNLDYDILNNALKLLSKDVNGEVEIDMHSLVEQLTNQGEKFADKEELIKMIEELAGPENAKTDLNIPLSKFTKNILGLQTINDFDGKPNLELAKVEN